MCKWFHKLSKGNMTYHLEREQKARKKKNNYLKAPIRSREIVIGTLRFLHPAEKLGRGHNVSGKRGDVSKDKGEMMSQSSQEEESLRLCPWEIQRRKQKRKGGSYWNPMAQRGGAGGQENVNIWLRHTFKSWFIHIIYATSGKLTSVSLCLPIY